MTKLTTEEFIAKAKAVHGDRYDYSRVDYTGNKAKVCIICRIHGEFWQEARMHLSGCGCPICSGRKKMRTIDFVKRAQTVHGNKYDYSKAEYKGNTEKVCVICPEHGEFWQHAGNHMKGVGCPKCGFIISSSKQRIWTRERCYELAMQYKDLTSFAKECQVAYGKACKNDWIKDYTWLERKSLPNGYWTKELVMEEAHKYTSSGDFKKGNKLAYSAACRNGWIKECVWFIKPWCAESLVRSGIKHLTIVDSDRVCITNINRQLMATSETVGQVKVEALKERLLSINPSAEITALQQIFTDETADSFDIGSYDYIIDAIDSLKDKALLILMATQTKAKFFSSMGAALKLDPTRIKTAEFWKVQGDPLARALRNRFKRDKVFPKRKFQCVYSDELLENKGTPPDEGEVPSVFNKPQTNGTLAHITAIFGFMLAGLVIQDICQ